MDGTQTKVQPVNHFWEVSSNTPDLSVGGLFHRKHHKFWAIIEIRDAIYVTEWCHFIRAKDMCCYIWKKEVEENKTNSGTWRRALQIWPYEPAMGVIDRGCILVNAMDACGETEDFLAGVRWWEQGVRGGKYRARDRGFQPRNSYWSGFFVSLVNSKQHGFLIWYAAVPCDLALPSWKDPTRYKASGDTVPAYRGGAGKSWRTHRLQYFYQ